MGNLDLDLAFISSVLSAGKDAFIAARDRGVQSDFLQGDAKKAWDFAGEYFRDYSTIPTLEIIGGRLGVLIEPVEGHPEFFTEEVLTRRVGMLLTEGIDLINRSFDVRKPREGLASMRELIRKIDSEHLVAPKVESLFAQGQALSDFYERMKSGARGILTPWPTINEATTGFWPEDFVLFAARPGIGKCIHEDSEIVDPETGVVRTIREVVEGPQKKIQTWSRESGIHSIDITAKVDTGRKVCQRITFASGRSITVTPEHPFLTAEGWKRADEFQPGMTAALAGRLPFPESPAALSADTVFLLALLLTEGSYTGHHYGFSTSDPRILEQAHAVASRFGGSVVHRDKYDYDFNGTGRGTPHPIRELLEQHDITNTLAKNKTIPEAVFRLPKEQLADFIAVFWMCDGYVDAGAPGIMLASEKMVRQLQHLLLRFGIQSSVNYKSAKYKGKEFDAWRLRVYSHCIDRFAQAFALWGDKRERLMGLRTTAHKRNSNVGFPRVSKSFVEKIRGIAKERRGGLVEAARKLGRTPSHERGHGSYLTVKAMCSRHHGLSLREFKAFCETYGIEKEYGWIYSPEIFWDVIETIESVGEQKIYDLTVAPTSCFVANDIVVHNTWITILLTEHAWWTQKKRVLLVSTEMSKLRLAMRFWAIHRQFNYKDLRTGHLGGGEEARFKESILQLQNEVGLYVVGGDFDYSLDAFEGAVEEVDPDVIILDGLYLIQTEVGKTRSDQMAHVFNEMKRIAKRKKKPIVATTQFNRGVDANDPKSVQGTDKIALSDAGGWNTDLAYALIQTGEMKADRKMIVRPLKFREGEMEDVTINWDIGLLNFTEVQDPNQGPFREGAPQPPPGAAPPPGAPQPAIPANQPLPEVPF